MHTGFSGPLGDDHPINVKLRERKRDRLGPRIPGPGFAMRWVRRAFYYGSLESEPTWFESTNPALEHSRHLCPVATLARECIEHDRCCDIFVRSKVLRFTGPKPAREASKVGTRHRSWMRAFARIAYRKAA